ncbi:Leucine--tRNA ligase [uncultured archaeon]|nr:Leucine--tRNA ligase [uncultured archaeon]
MTEYEHSAVESKWGRRWKEARVFESNPDGRGKFFLTVPYPYASGALHVGHARSYTLGDVTARFQRMLGKNVLFPMASHITGTPILAISTKIQQKNPKALASNKEYVGFYVKDEKKVEEIVNSFTEPQNVANFYANAIIQDFESMGYSIDWRRFFTTGDKEYNAFIRWQYHHLKERGYLVKGKHPVFYCPREDNPVTTDDIESGDEYTVEMAQFNLLKEPFQDGYLVAATLRPETIFGVVNVWVNPDKEYVKAKVDGEFWYVAPQFVEKYKSQQHEVEIIERLKGKDLIEKKVRIPLAERDVPILPAPFVDVNIATGVVNSVPAHAPYDYVAGEEIKAKYPQYDLKPITLIRTSGYQENPAKDLIEKEGIKSQADVEKLEKVTADLYRDEFYRGITNKNCGEFANMKVQEAKEAVTDELKAKKLLATMYENGIKDKQGKPVIEPHCRCGSPIIIKVLPDQWFLDYGNRGWKDDAKSLLENMRIEPDSYRRGFEHTISWLHEWPCTRNRGLGTRLPFDERWVIESLSDSTIYMAYYTFVHKIRNKVPAEKLSVALFNHIFLGLGDTKKISHETGLTEHAIKELRDEFTYWYPMDERRTATAHISNHLTFMIFHHAALFPANLWPKQISLNEMLIAEGRKMSKSLGNVIPIRHGVERLGADTMRMYLVYAADPATTLDWRESQVDNARKRIKQFYDIATEIATKPKEAGEENELDLWMLNRVDEAAYYSRSALEEGNVRKAVQVAFYDMLSNYNWYVRRSGNHPGTLRHFAETWVKLMTPLTPFLCEELWETLGKTPFVSNEKYPEGKQADPEVDAGENMVKLLLEDVQKILEVTKVAPKKIHLYVAPDWKRKAYALIKEGKTMKEAMADPEIRPHGKDAAKIMQSRKEELPQTIYSKEKETSILNGAKEFIGREFNAEVTVHTDASHDPQGKAKYALPMRPGVYVEA